MPHPASESLLPQESDASEEQDAEHITPDHAYAAHLAAQDADLHRLQTHAIRRIVFPPRSWIEDRWPLVFPIPQESDDDGWEEEMGWIEECDGFRLNWH